MCTIFHLLYMLPNIILSSVFFRSLHLKGILMCLKAETMSSRYNCHLYLYIIIIICWWSLDFFLNSILNNPFSSSLDNTVPKFQTMVLFFARNKINKLVINTIFITNRRALCITFINLGISMILFVLPYHITSAAINKKSLISSIEY